MRQLKAFMKAKKRWRCKCLTLNMWRCWEFCWCVNECGEVEVAENNNITPEPTPAPAPIVEPEPTPEPEPTDDENNDNYVEPEIPDEILDNPGEDSLDDLNS